MGRSGGYELNEASNPLSDENNFSEEEEALFVADNDTESENDRIDEEQRGHGLELGNVTAFRRNPEHDNDAQAPQSVSFIYI